AVPVRLLAAEAAALEVHVGVAPERLATRSARDRTEHAAGDRSLGRRIGLRLRERHRRRDRVAVSEHVEAGRVLRLRLLLEGRRLVGGLRGGRGGAAGRGARAAVALARARGHAAAAGAVTDRAELGGL